MIQVKKKTTGIELSDSKNLCLLAEKEIRLNEHSFSETGEYEVGGIEIVFGHGGALLINERIKIGYVFDDSQINDFEKEQLAGLDVLILAPTVSKTTLNQFERLSSQFEPKIVIFSESPSDELAKLTITETNQIKLQFASLPTEGKEYYRLN